MGRKQTAEGETVSAIASETVALAFLEYDELQEIQAGEAVHITADGVVTRQIIDQQSKSPCMFEW
ncbi:amidophosphoribosyltransferase, partial [Escherichia coli]